MINTKMVLKKDFAEIYDVLVKPNIEGMRSRCSVKLEIGIIRRQLLKKLTEMSELAG